VPSSTSSFRWMVLKAPYGRLWIGTVVLAVAALALLEAMWRWAGYMPAVADTMDLWAYHRKRIEGADSRTVVFLGRSRIQEGLVHDEFLRGASEHEIINLCIRGLHPMAVLRDIAVNTDFGGVVVCSVTAEGLLPEQWDHAAPWVEFYHREYGPARHWEQSLALLVEPRLCILTPMLALQNIGPDLLRGEWPRQLFRTLPSREQVARYRDYPLEELRASQLRFIARMMNHFEETEGYGDWPAGIEAIDAWVRRIEDRGGRVVFYRAVTSGEYHGVEVETFPREQFWDVFAENISAPAVHFQDVPELAAMETAEGSHLYRDDAVIFSRVIARELKALGVLPLR